MIRENQSNPSAFTLKGFLYPTIHISKKCARSRNFFSGWVFDKLANRLCSGEHFIRESPDELEVPLPCHFSGFDQPPIIRGSQPLR